MSKPCKHCRTRHPESQLIETRQGKFCSVECISLYAADKDQLAKARKYHQKTQQKDRREKKKQKTYKRKELMKRSEWYAKLQTLVNQYVRWRDRDEGCCTCGTTNPNIKYDAGHFHTKKARPDIRFELTNIHKQCSQQCNVYNSGMRKEYQEFLIEKYGAEHVEWLAEIKPGLHEQFPNWQDIEEEIKRYRKLLREVGIKPNV